MINDKEDPSQLNGLYTTFVSPVPGGQKPLQRGGVKRRALLIRNWIILHRTKCE